MTPTPVIDAHHHFFVDPNDADVAWMTGRYAMLRRPFGPQDLAPLLRDAGIDGTVLVQTRSSLEETRTFLQIAEATSFVRGVVGWVDLTDSRVGETIAQLVGRPGGARLVGVRHQVHDEPDERWLRRHDVRAGLQAVEHAGLVYDLLVRPRELPAALETVRELPGLRFVVDHIGKPPIACAKMDGWAHGMAALAAEPNVWVKLSGMVTEADLDRWTPGDLAPYVEAVRGWFGDERLLFGSDWPVCLVAASYQRVKEALETLLAAIDDSQRARIFGGNAVELYRLPD